MIPERDAVAIFRRHLGPAAPEDVSLFKAGCAKMAVNVDAFAAGSDMPPGSSLRDAGYKSVASCVSDFAAKGARPVCGVVAVALPDHFTKSDISKLARGISAAKDEFGLEILGGDTGSGLELTVSVTLMGTASEIVPRRGAAAGDLIFATGSFGYAAAGLAILNGKKAFGSFASAARRALLRPRPPLEFGIRCAPLMSSSMDSSDGLSACLIEMSRQSGMMFLIDRLPADAGISKFAAQNGIDASDLILHGGDEYEIVFTAPAARKRRILSIAKSHSIKISVIGRVMEGSGAYIVSKGRRRAIPDLGWQHF